MTTTDPVAIRQWVAAIGLVLQAEDAARRGSQVDLLTALVVADTAIEACLGVLSRRAPGSAQSEEFGAHLRRALAKAPRGLHADIQGVHKIRNASIHHGAGASLDDVRRAIEAARVLTDEYVPRKLRLARVLPAGAGIGDGVAEVVGDHPVSERLRGAQRAIGQGDARAALELVAEGLDIAERITYPPLPRSIRSIVLRQGAPLSREIGEVDRNARGMARWLAPMALGMSPADYARMTDPLPSHVRTDEYTYHHRWGKKPEPTLDAARRSLERLSQLVLRLWLSDLVRKPEMDG